METKIRPIFLIGRHRSGTTWLANLLCCNPSIFSPQHVEHKGVHESAFFACLVRYCNWGKRSSDLWAIKCIFEASDFYRLLGLPKKSISIRDGYSRYFHVVMEQAALARGAEFWLEKTPTHSLLLRYLTKWYPDAIFLNTERKFLDIVRSNVWGWGNPRNPFDWMWHGVITGVYDSIIELYKNNMITVAYEDLVVEESEIMSNIFDTLGIGKFEITGLDYKKNSSFAGEKPDLRWWQRWAAMFGGKLVSPIPNRWIEHLTLALLRRRRANLPEWFFRLAESERLDE